MKRILSTIITPPVMNPRFGEGDTPPPVPPTPPSNSPDADELMSFEPPDIDDVVANITGNAPPAPPVTPPPVTPPAPKPPAAPDPKKPVDPPKPPDLKNDPPAKQLREELDRTKEELRVAKEQMGKGDPRIKELEDERDRIKTEIAARDTKLTDYEKRLALADPAVTKELRDFDDKLTQEGDAFYRRVPEISHQQISDLTREYHALPFGKEGYREARAAFEAKVNAALGAGEGSEHRKLNATLDFIEKFHTYAVERPVIEKRIQDSALKLRQDSQLGEHSSARTFVSENLAAAKTIPEGMEQSDPLHPRVMLAAFEKVLPPDQAAAFTAGVPEFIELVFAGPKPFNPADFVGQTPAQIAESQRTQAERHTAAKAAAIDLIYNGTRALRLMPSLIKDWQRLKAKVKDDADLNPPDPTKDGDPSKAAVDDIRNFQAPEIPEF